MVRKRATPESRKNQIIAAADLVLLEVGIDRFTVDQVIDKAKIAKGTVYNYYKNKDEMLADLAIKALSLLHHHFKNNTERLENSIDKIKAICMTSYEYNKQYPEYFELISHTERPEFNINISEYLKLSYDIQHLTDSIIREGQQKGEIKSTLNTTMCNYILWASCVGVVQFIDTKKKLLKNHHEINTKQMVESFAEMITKGIST